MHFLYEYYRKTRCISHQKCSEFCQSVTISPSFGKKIQTISSTVLLSFFLCPLLFPPIYSGGRRLCILKPIHTHFFVMPTMANLRRFLVWRLLVWRLLVRRLLVWRRLALRLPDWHLLDQWVVVWPYWLIVSVLVVAGAVVLQQLVVWHQVLPWRVRQQQVLRRWDGQRWVWQLSGWNGIRYIVPMLLKLDNCQTRGMQCCQTWCGETRGLVWCPCLQMQQSTNSKN